MENNNKFHDEEFKPIKNYNIFKYIFFGGIGLILILFTIYYFILDNPKNILKSLINNTNMGIDISNYNFDMDINIDSSDEIINYISNIVNNIDYNMDIISNDNEGMLDLNLKYKDKDLPNINLIVKEDKIYLKSNNIYDYGIKYTLESDAEEDTIDSKLLEQYLKEYLKDIKIIKTYKKHNNKFMKQVSIIMNKEVNNEYIDKLENDDKLKDFLVENNFNSLLDLMKDKDIVIDFYLGIFNNKLDTMIATINASDEEGKFIIRNINNKYLMEFFVDNTLLIRMNYELNMLKDSFDLKLIYELIEEETDINVNIKGKKSNKKINEIDDKYLETTEISEETTTELYNNLLENEGIKEIIKDLFGGNDLNSLIM